MIDAPSRTGRRALAVVAAAVLAGAGSMPARTKAPPPQSFRSDMWRPVLDSDCRSRLRAKPAPGHRYVYFSCEPRKGPLVPAAAARELSPRDASPARALRILLRGPTAAERAAGFVSNFGRKTGNLRFRVTVDRRRGLAVVDLDPAIMRVDFVFVSVQDVAQITSTVGQFPPVRRVAILVGGRPLCEKVDIC
jgi:spore germination protein GerM